MHDYNTQLILKALVDLSQILNLGTCEDARYKKSLYSGSLFCRLDTKLYNLLVV